MIKKLRQKKGETLVETLFAMLISILSMGILCSAVLAATSMNDTTRKLDKKYSDQLFMIEGLDPNIATPGHGVTISFVPVDGSSPYTIENNVTLYGDEESVFLSYDYEGGTP